MQNAGRGAGQEGRVRIPRRMEHDNELFVLRLELLEGVLIEMLHIAIADGPGFELRAFLPRCQLPCAMR